LNDRAKIFLQLLLSVLVIVSICGLGLWALSSPLVDDYYWIHRRDTEAHLALAFTIALRTNHPSAYDMIDSSLEPRLDEWMSVHKGKRCTRQANTVLIGGGTTEGYKVVFSCFGQNNWLDIEVDNIVIKDMKVVDWGDVSEENG
jgi:hypothetical protein